MKRYHILDDIRGINLVSMILYHATWDLVYMFGVDWSWYHTKFAYIWQQSICWTFILLSGFCWSLGSKQLRRGIQVFAAGAIVSLVTELFMPDQRVRFGVLTFLGTAMLLLIPLEKILKKIPAIYGLIISFVTFILLRNINSGEIGFENVFTLFRLPEPLYHGGDMATFIGFTDTRFYSTDYFSLLPWIFLFIVGYYLYKLCEEKNFFGYLERKKSLGCVWRMIGRNSLLIYMLHQPVVYVVLLLLDKVQII